MDRPIVVNSLLCFIHNYRHSLLPEQLNSLLHNYFSKSAISMAHATLTELLPSTGALIIDDNDNDLLYLFDRITSSEQSPVFAAADLNMLPLQLITDEDDSKNELLREIRQLKRFIQDALNGRVDEPAPQADSSVQTTTTTAVEQPDCDLHGQILPSCCSASSKSSLKSSTSASTSSPELPSSTSLISTPCSSFIPTTMMSPASPCHEHHNHLQSDSHPNIIGTSNTPTSTIAVTSRAIINSNGNNSSNGICTNSSTCSNNSIIINNNYNRRKRDGCGNRLDAMVRKLADRQKEKEAAAAAAAAAVIATATATTLGNVGAIVTATSMSSLSSTSTISSSSSCSSSSTTTMLPPEPSPPPPTTLWHTTQMIDPIAYVSMLRTMTGAVAAAAATSAISSPSSIFPSVNKTAQNDRFKSDSITEFGDNLEDGSIDLGEKNSNESSPSPSDSSNNVDEASYTADLAEKPFTCEHTNCHKRFANKFLLKKHQFIHTGLRPHCCPFCGKRFNRKDNLLRHKKTHLANALGTDITSALSNDDFMLQLGADKAAIKLDNDPEEENES